MDNLNNLINQSVKSLESTQPLTQEQKPASKLYRVEGGVYTKEELAWKRFSGLYGYTFTRQYGEEPIAEWLMVLERTSADQIKKGIDGCIEKHKQFPPNPMQFLTLCLPSGIDYGLPGDSAAFKQAIGVDTKKHPSVAMTLRNMGDDVFRMRNLPTKEAQDIFNNEWVKTVLFVADGGELPDAAIEIDQDKAKRMDKDKAMPLFASIKASLGEPEEPEQVDMSAIESELKLRGKV